MRLAKSNPFSVIILIACAGLVVECVPGDPVEQPDARSFIPDLPVYVRRPRPRPRPQPQPQQPQSVPAPPITTPNVFQMSRLSEEQHQHFLQAFHTLSNHPDMIPMHTTHASRHHAMPGMGYTTPPVPILNRPIPTPNQPVPSLNQPVPSLNQPVPSLNQDLSLPPWPTVESHVERQLVSVLLPLLDPPHRPPPPPSSLTHISCEPATLAQNTKSIHCSILPNLSIPPTAMSLSMVFRMMRMYIENKLPVLDTLSNPQLQDPFTKTFTLNYPNQPSQSTQNIFQAESFPPSQDWTVTFRIHRPQALVQASGEQNWEFVELVLRVGPVTVD